MSGASSTGQSGGNRPAPRRTPRTRTPGVLNSSSPLWPRLEASNAMPTTPRMTGRGRSQGTAGGSARREHDRRKARREADLRARRPRIGGLLLAFDDAPERRWAHGAQGEELVAEALANRGAPSVAVLHDRRMPRSRANIDHLVVAPSGIWVVDTKRYK